MRDAHSWSEEAHTAGLPMALGTDLIRAIQLDAWRAGVEQAADVVTRLAVLADESGNTYDASLLDHAAICVFAIKPPPGIGNGEAGT